MPKIIIEFSLIKESSKGRKDDILKEISEAFANEDIVVPWCDKIEKITFGER